MSDTWRETLAALAVSAWLAVAAWAVLHWPLLWLLRALGPSQWGELNG